METQRQELISGHLRETGEDRPSPFSGASLGLEKGPRPGFTEKWPIRAYFQEGRIIKKIGFQIWILEPGLGALGSGAWALGSGGW